MEYETGKRLDIINEKLDAILVKLYPEINKTEDKKN